MREDDAGNSNLDGTKGFSGWFLRMFFLYIHNRVILSIKNSRIRFSYHKSTISAYSKAIIFYKSHF